MKSNRAAYDAFIKVYPLSIENLDDEEWKWFPNYEGLYQVSTFGRIKSFRAKEPRIIKPAFNNGGKGYLKVVLCKAGAKKPFLVHRLVALAFIPNTENKPEINHIDGCPLNCHVSNLEWVTSKENENHAVKIGLIKSGEDNYQAKLTNEQAVYIRENPDGLTQEQLARIFGVSSNIIGYIQIGKTYKKAGGDIRKARSLKCTPRLSDNLREQIRSEYKPNVRGYGSHVLAKKYNVSKRTILNIIHEIK